MGWGVPWVRCPMDGEIPWLGWRGSHRWGVPMSRGIPMGRLGGLMGGGIPMDELGGSHG